MKGLEYVDVIVDRGNTKIPVTVPEYEIAVLERIHNQDTSEGMIEMVHVGESRVLPITDYEGKLAEFNPVEAFNSLRRKYERPNAPSPVTAVYANPRDLASRVKLHDIDGRTLKRKTAETPA